MKKLLAIIVLGLLWSKIGYADHQCGAFKEIKDSIVCKSGENVNEHTCKCENWFDQFEKPIDLSKLEGVTPAKKPLEKMSGSTLFCRNSSEDIYDFGIEFKFMNRVTVTQVDTDIEKITAINGTYKELSDKIIINYKNEYGEKDKATIYRTTGRIPRFDATCELHNDAILSLRERLDLRLNKFIKNKSSKNKF